jgi:hypothetical protein
MVSESYLNKAIIGKKEGRGRKGREEQRKEGDLISQGYSLM